MNSAPFNETNVPKRPKGILKLLCLLGVALSSLVFIRLLVALGALVLFMQWKGVCR